jgi:hypothetical protein
MIALVISGLALTLIFSIGNRASSSGFSLGRRVLSLSDRQIEALSFRALIEALVVPSGLDTPATGLGLRRLGPENLVGTPDRISGSAVLARDTLCADAGPLAHLELQIRQVGGRWQLVCLTPLQPETVLMALGQKPAKFSYSQDGNIWTDTIDIRPGPTDPNSYDSRYRARTYYIRLSNADLTMLLIERTTTGRPRPPALTVENM